MSSVDDRIVNMQFNNRQFQSGVTDTQRSLDGLEQALAKTGQSGGLTALSNGVEQTTSRFGAMRIAGITAIATIAAKATSAGLTLLKSMTLDPLIQGFQEYELNLKSTQTIIANTGAGISTVSKYLKELNDYSDKTIYNFSQMASSIGKFTAAGVNLSDATDAIKGMANSAALSGAEVHQLNSAMYQMSQALATGTIKLMDWNSLVNANMGGTNMQDSLKATAVSMGAAGDAMTEAIATSGSFRDSLQSGWLTADIFTKTMKVMAGQTINSKDDLKALGMSAEEFAEAGHRMGDTVAFSVKQLKAMGYETAAAEELNRLSGAAIDSATKIKTFTQLIDVVKESIGSGWASIFQSLFGNLEQAQDLWTSVGNTITDAIGFIFDSVSVMLGVWRKAGGFTAMWQGFANIFKALGNILAPFVNMFRDLVPDTGKGKRLAELSKGFESVTGAIEKFTRHADILTPVLSLIAKGVVLVFKGLAALAPIVGFVASALSDLVGKGADIARDLLGGLVEGLDPQQVVGAITALAQNIVQWIKDALGIHSPSTEMIPVGEGIIMGIVEGIIQYAGVLIDAVGRLADGLAPLGARIVDGLVEGIKGGAGALAGAIKSLGSMLISAAVDLAKDLAGAIAGALSAIGDSAGAAGDSVGSAGISFGDIWTKTVEGLKFALSAVGETFEKLGGAAAWLAEQFGDLFGGLDAMEWAGLINALFSGALLLTIKNLAGSFSGFGDSFTGTFNQVTDTLQSMQNALKAQILKAIAISVALLVASIVALSLLEPKQLAQGIGALVTTMGILAGTMYLLGKTNKAGIAAVGTAILQISIAMVALSGAIAILGNMDMETLGKGIGAMAAALGLMVLAVLQFSGLEGAVVSAGASIAIMSGAMIALAAAVLAFGSMSLETLAKGLGAMGIGLGLMVHSLLALSINAKGVLAGAAAIAIVSGALIALSVAVLAFGNMDLETLAVGFSAVAIGLGLFVGTLNLLAANMAGVMAAGVAMVLMATSLNILVSVILILGTAPWEIVARGLAFVAAALAIFLLAGLGAMAIIPGLQALGFFVLALGAAMLLAGAGMTLFAAALTILVGLGVAAIALIVAAIEVFLAMLPTIAIQVASAFVAFLEVIANASPKIRKHMITILKNMIGTVRDAIPEFRKLIQDLISAGIKVIRDSVPEMIEAAFHIIDSFLTEVDSHLPEFIERGKNIIITMIQGLSKAAVEIAEATAQAILDFLVGLRKAIEKYDGQIRDAGLDLAYALVNGMTGGLLDWGVSKVRAAIETLMEHIPGWAKKILGISSPSKVMMELGRFVSEGFAKGIMQGIKDAVNAALQMANAVIAAGDSKVAEAQRKARKLQQKADRRDARADITERQANQARRAADKFAKENPKQKQRIKELERRAKELAKQASNERAAADEAQKQADKAAQNVEDVRTFQEADNVGKGDIRQAQSVALADRAAKMLAKANAEAAEARRLMKTNKEAGRKMLEQARKDAREAKRLAELAATRNAQAQRFYEMEVEERLAALVFDAEFEKADTAGKVSLLNEKALELEDKAAKAREAQAKAIAAAQAAAAAGNHAEALRLIAEAEKAAAEAKAAEEEAKRQRDLAAQLLGGGTGGTGGTGGGGLTTSILEDAAKVMDRYTESLQQAEILAAAQQTVYQFNQNNYSPEALTPSEIYRQSKNLLSTAELKMVVNPVTSE